MARSKGSVDMTQGSIWKHLVTFAVPMLIGQLFQQLYTIVDSVVVGQFVGKEALAAVGATGNVINALIGFFVGLSTGAGVVISQFFGARDEKGVHDAVHTSVFFTIIISVFCTFLGIFLAPYIMTWMDTPDDVLGDAVAYLRIYFAGVSGMMMYNIGSGILRAVGDSKRPLYFLIFSAVLNLVLDIVFVCFVGMGVDGVAWATIISQFLSAILCFVVLSRSHECYRIVWQHLRPNWSVMRRVMIIGVPGGLQTAITSLSNVFVQAYINAFQSSCMAGWTSYSRLDAFAWLPMLSIGLASTTFVGQNLGAGKLERAKKGVTIALVISLISTTAVVIPLMLFAEPLLRLFNGDPEVLYYGKMFVLAMSPFYIPYSFTQIYSGALRGVGDSVSPAVICVGSFVVFRQIYLAVGTLFINTPLFVGLSYPVGWMMASLCMTIVYHSKRWEKKLRQNGFVEAA